jgi:hypothetical protein
MASEEPLKPLNHSLGLAPEFSAAPFDTDEAFLTELRGHSTIIDPEADLRADALVERLRRAHPEFSTPPSQIQRVPELPTLVPERLEYFRVEKLLGRGGMGTVFLAFDTRLNRQVAVKILRPDLARDPRFKERFLREGRTAAALDHPNVVNIYYVGEAEGVPFLAMPLLKGESLESWLKQRTQTPPVGMCVHIIRQIATGLAAFHQQGMIHRDIKPSNIWLEPSTTHEVQVKILDFGLARTAASEPLTEAGAILGTPAYMAPEQARGINVDQRADLFSLGCVMYQLITLKRAFDGPDTLATLLSLALDQPKEPALSNPDCPPALSQLTLELLAKEPQDRPADVPEVLVRLAAFEDDLVVNDQRKALTFGRPKRPGWGSQARSAQRRWLAFGLMFLLVVLMGGIYVVTDQGTIVIDTDDPAVRVIVEDGGGRVTILDPESKQSWRLNTGTYKVRVDGNEREIDLTSPFQMKRGDRIVATIRKFAPRSKDASDVAADADRPIAEKMLLLGGVVTVESDTKAIVVERLRDLSSGNLRLLEVNFFDNKEINDNDLAALKPAHHLWNVNLSHTKITDAGLKHVASLPKLTLLSLDDSLVTNAGLPTLKNCSELKSLGLSYSKVTEAGLVHVKEMVQLETLGLCGLGITDAGLARLQNMKNLQHLGLDQSPISDLGLEHLKTLTNLKKLGLVTTKVTVEGVKKLAQSLPACTIYYENGFVAPKTLPQGEPSKSPAK